MGNINVGGIKFGDTQLTLPTAKFSSTPIFPAIQYIHGLLCHGEKDK